MPENAMLHLQSCFETQKAAFALDNNPSLEVRLDRLRRLKTLLIKYEKEFIEAIDQDFCGRSHHETRLAELLMLKSNIKHAHKHLAKWMKPETIKTALPYFPAKNSLIPQPLGVVGVVAAWNYPLQLLLSPAICALAAGNRVMLKSSELAPKLGALLASCIHEYFETDEMVVITGELDISQAFVALPFDHLCFTGSTQVGRHVAIAAAQNLTPVTLELGGKSPAILDTSANWDDALPKIVYGKLLNSGQTCIAPDYLMVPKGTAQDVAERLVGIASQYYPSIRDNPDYTSIISVRHRQRLFDLLIEIEEDSSTIYVANPANENFETGTNKIPPTFVTNPLSHRRIMTEEIFGPILPIIEYDDLDEAIQYINERPRPLALYWFGSKTAHRDVVLQKTISGGVTINDCILHIAQEEQPFGGVGDSGIGAYHGSWGFKTFSKLKPVFYQSRFSKAKALRPPYGRSFEKTFNLLKKLST